VSRAANWDDLAGGSRGQLVSVTFRPGLGSTSRGPGRIGTESGVSALPRATRIRHTRQMSRYDPLTDALRAAAARGPGQVELSFSQIEEIVGHPLPESSQQRQWWANSSHTQALAWRAAGFHVEQVYLDRKRVRFARGEVGGSYAAHGRIAGNPVQRQPAASVHRVPAGPPLEVRIRVQWLDAGAVTADRTGKPTFAGLEAAPGLYRMTLTGGLMSARPRLYIGESGNLRKRLAGNYRNSTGGDTSKRISTLLREHLGADGEIALVVATDATIWLDDVEQPLNLGSKAGRLFAENAALVAAHIWDNADVENLP
jgi:hypothetical protein